MARIAALSVTGPAPKIAKLRAAAGASTIARPYFCP
jgi:hypothetical protein